MDSSPAGRPAVVRHRATGRYSLWRVSVGGCEQLGSLPIEAADGAAEPIVLVSGNAQHPAVVWAGPDGGVAARWDGSGLQPLPGPGSPGGPPAGQQLAWQVLGDGTIVVSPSRRHDDDEGTERLWLLADGDGSAAPAWSLIEAPQGGRITAVARHEAGLVVAAYAKTEQAGANIGLLLDWTAAGFRERWRAPMPDSGGLLRRPRWRGNTVHCVYPDSTPWYLEQYWGQMYEVENTQHTAFDPRTGQTHATQQYGGGVVAGFGTAAHGGPAVVTGEALLLSFEPGSGSWQRRELAPALQSAGNPNGPKRVVSAAGLDGDELLVLTSDGYVPKGPWNERLYTSRDFGRTFTESGLAAAAEGQIRALGGARVSNAVL